MLRSVGFVWTTVAREESAHRNSLTMFNRQKLSQKQKLKTHQPLVDKNKNKNPEGGGRRQAGHRNKEITKELRHEAHHTKREKTKEKTNLEFLKEQK